MANIKENLVRLRNVSIDIISQNDNKSQFSFFGNKFLFIYFLSDTSTTSQDEN